MDVATAIDSLFVAVGLAGPAGLNAYLPPLLGAVPERMGVVELGEPVASLSGDADAGVAVLTILSLADFAATGSWVSTTPSTPRAPPSTPVAGALLSISLIEDVASLALTVVAFALPVVALVLVIALVAGILSGGRRLSRRRASHTSRRGVPPSPSWPLVRPAQRMALGGLGVGRDRLNGHVKPRSAGSSSWPSAATPGVTPTDVRTLRHVSGTPELLTHHQLAPGPVPPFAWLSRRRARAR